MVSTPTVHLATTPTSRGLRHSVAGRAYPLDEPSMPRGDGTYDGLGRIVEYLDVERSARYQPAVGKTYCNIYAYDYCYLAGAYLPRVWWNQTAIVNLKNGRDVAPIYGLNVFEVNANGLHDWLQKTGPEYGWRIESSVAPLALAARHGYAAVICAKRRDTSRSGHITCVVGDVLDRGMPVQSQAGTTNKKRFVNNWWLEPAMGYSSYVFAWFDTAPAAPAPVRDPRLSFDPSSQPVIGEGRENPQSAVSLLRLVLVELGYSFTLSGGWDAELRSAVEHFQSSKGLKADGVVGTKQTWPALRRAIG